MPNYQIVCPECGSSGGVEPCSEGCKCVSCGHVFPTGTDMTRYFKEVDLNTKSDLEK